MKYIKLFENNSFQIISSNDYYNIIGSFYNVNTNLSISIDFTDFELKKIVDIVSKYSLSVDLQIKDYKVNNENTLIFRLLPKDLIWIKKVNDDYYYIKYLKTEVWGETESNYFFIKCDQINGIKNYLISLKQI